METVAIDRLAMRAKPDGSPAMHQNWDSLLFLHWPIDVATIRPLIPAPLEIDTFDGKAWMGITPFALNDLRLLSFPALPGLDSFLEVNVRTYVHYRGLPGVWFFSLDASKLIPAVAARVLFLLPYFKAEMEFAQSDDEFHFSSRRVGLPSAQLESRWRVGLRLRAPDPDSLAFFLVERYCLFTTAGGQVRMTRVYHPPWILDEALVLSHRSTMLEQLGLTEPADPPLAHFSRSLNVEIWPPTDVS